jgi:signal peptidase II
VTPPRLGSAVAIVVFGLDQALKAWILVALDGRYPVALAPFLDLRLAWNTGISYSLFRSDGPVARLALLGLALAVTVVLGFWLARARRPIAGVALGLIIGGALGNACDRFVHGAVADFIHVHLGGFSPWGVFNLADTAIVAGVGLLLYETFMMAAPERGREPSGGS